MQRVYIYLTKMKLQKNSNEGDFVGEDFVVLPEKGTVYDYKEWGRGGASFVARAGCINYFMQLGQQISGVISPDFPLSHKNVKIIFNFEIFSYRKSMKPIEN